jgi:AcrR family transcriptional regulator
MSCSIHLSYAHVNMAGEKRRYDNSARADKAARTRDRVIDSAMQLFATRGYERTTMAEIARAAGVSVERVYANGPKSALLYAAMEVAFFGREGTIPIFEHDIGERLLEAQDAQTTCRTIANWAADRYEHYAGVWFALEVAAEGDPDVAAHRDLAYEGMLTALGDAGELGQLRGWVQGNRPRRERVAAAFAVIVPDAYRRVATTAGLGKDGYITWLSAALLWSLYG